MQKRTSGLLASNRVHFLPISKIRPNPAQPRKVFDSAGLGELAASICQFGILQPLSVRKLPDGNFELVAGERRLRASRMAGLSEVPCILVSASDEDSGLLAMIENLQRRDLDYIEQAQALAKLMQAYHFSQEQTAQKLGKSQSAIANKLRLLHHSPAVILALRENHLSERHARALLRLSDEDEQLRVISLISAGDWTVARTESYLDTLLSARPQTQRRALSPFSLRSLRPFLNAVEHQMLLLKSAGISASTEQKEQAEELLLIIHISKPQIAGK